MDHERKFSLGPTDSFLQGKTWFTAAFPKRYRVGCHPVTSLLLRLECANAHLDRGHGKPRDYDIVEQQGDGDFDPLAVQTLKFTLTAPAAASPPVERIATQIATALGSSAASIFP